MLEVLANLQWYGYYGGGRIGEVITQWQEAGIFAILLPFLLIFAVVYGILTKANFFGDNKAIAPIIAVVVGIMAIQFEMVPRFFSEIFPRLGIGLAIILIVIILLGMFSPNDAWVVYTTFGIATIILVVILVKTAGVLGWSTGFWWQENWPTVAGAVFIIAVLGAIVGASRPKTPFAKVASPWLKALHGITSPSQ